MADGRNAAVQDVVVAVSAEGLLLRRSDDGEVLLWRYADLVLVEDELQGGLLRLAKGDARLSMANPGFATALFDAAPQLRHSHRRSFTLAGIAAAVFVLVVAGLWWRGSDLTAALADALPPAWEQFAGDRLMAQLPFRRCDNEAGVASLGKLTARLTKGLDPRIAISVGVYDVPIVNAFALPGGHVLLLRGLLREAETPDEIAGVMAHEIGHVMHRDPTRSLLTQAGIGLAVQLATGGGSGGSLATQLVSLSYSRGVEAAADQEAVNLLRRSGIGTQGLASFFERLAKRSPDLLPPFLSSHPAPQTREAAVAKAPQLSAMALLSLGEWQALRDICNEIAK